MGRRRRSRPTLHGLHPPASHPDGDGIEVEGYVAEFEVGDAPVGKTLTITLKYGPSRERSIAGLRRVSKPGLRVYAKSTQLPKVLGGLGIAIISTSGGLVTERQAAPSTGPIGPIFPCSMLPRRCRRASPRPASKRRC